MRRWWGFASCLSVPLFALTATAEEADVVATAPAEQTKAPQQAIVYGAMPGGIHAPSAETLPEGSIQLSMLTGVGRRTGLLGEDHTFNRAIGGLAVAFGATANISVGLSLDGRYDWHSGLSPSGDDGYVGDPKLIVRAASSTGSVAFGGQLGIWIPGNDAPSVVASAISIDARALVSLPAGPGILSFSGGFRLDNSVESVDEPQRLSLEDRVSLGVADYHALMFGAQLRLPTGDRAWVAAEGSFDAFVGGPPESSGQGMASRAELARGTLTFRGGLTAGVRINNSMSAIGFIEVAKVPGIDLAQVIDNNIPLIPYEPIVTGGIGFQARFGGPTSPPRLFVEKDCAKREPPDCPAVKVAITTDITGTVVDTTGKPVVGAKVLLTLKNSQVEPVVTDDKGGYVFKGVRIGDSLDGKQTLDESAAEVSASAGGLKPGNATIAQLATGSNAAPPITLEPALPPGELRGVVRSLPGGKPIKDATIVVEPGGQTIKTDEEGVFKHELAPGRYKIKVTAPNWKPQELAVTIETNGVAIKNIDLQK